MNDNQREKVMNKITKTFTSVAIAVGMVSAVATSASAAEFDGVTLKVATWGGSWKANIEKIIVPKLQYQRLLV